MTKTGIVSLTLTNWTARKNEGIEVLNSISRNVETQQSILDNQAFPYVMSRLELVVTPVAGATTAGLPADLSGDSEPPAKRKRTEPVEVIDLT